MNRSRATRALAPATLACLLAATPALAAAPVRGQDGGPPVERPGLTERVRGAVVSLWERLLLVVRDDDDRTEGDRMPGSGLDPDGHKPPPDRRRAPR